MMIEDESRLVCQACRREVKRLVRYYGDHWVCPECLAHDMEHDAPIMTPVFAVRQDADERRKVERRSNGS